MNGHRQAHTGEYASIVDVDAADRAATDLLRALGVDVSSPSFTRTPKRVVAAYQELLSSHEFEMSIFPNDSGYRELVVAQSIPFRSLCEHPFSGVAHVGRTGVPDSGTHDRPNRNVARQAPRPTGAGVVVHAQHTCMTVRGVRAARTVVTTLSLHGLLRDDQHEQRKFMALTRVGVEELG